MISSDHIVNENDIIRINQALQELAVLSNESPDAVFQVTYDGFDIWLTKDNHPKGWEEYPIKKGERGVKPAILLAHCVWEKADKKVIGLHIKTNSIELRNYLDQKGLSKGLINENRLEDIQWAIEQIVQLCKIARVGTPPLYFEKEK